jgi:hypothetical protein
MILRNNFGVQYPVKIVEIYIKACPTTRAYKTSKYKHILIVINLRAMHDCPISQIELSKNFASDWSEKTHDNHDL